MQPHRPVSCNSGDPDLQVPTHQIPSKLSVPAAQTGPQAGQDGASRRWLSLPSLNSEPRAGQDKTASQRRGSLG